MRHHYAQHVHTGLLLLLLLKITAPQQTFQRWMLGLTQPNLNKILHTPAIIPDSCMARPSASQASLSPHSSS